MGSILEPPPEPSVTVAVEVLKAGLGNLTSSVAAGRLEGLSESELLVVVVDLQAIRSQIEADTDLAAMTGFEADLDDPVSSWNRFLGEQPRHVLDIGRSRRTAPPKIRRALTIRDGGCAAPDCDVDASRCEAHHITFWENHGETSVSTMVLLCAKHRHMVHEGRWRIERHPALDPGHPGYVTLAAPSPAADHRAPQRSHRHRCDRPTALTPRSNQRTPRRRPGSREATPTRVDAPTAAACP